jgi:hypothetical protein
LRDDQGNLPPLRATVLGIHRDVQEIETVAPFGLHSPIFQPLSNIRISSTWFYRLCCVHNPDCALHARAEKPFQNPEMIIEP